MILSWLPYTLYFRRPFKIAHGLRTSTPVTIVKLEHEGFTGYGEASMPPYLGESHQSVSSFLEKAAALLKQFNDPSELEKILWEVDRISPGNSAAKASIDIALHDLAGKLSGKPCRELFGAEKRPVFTSYTLGIDEPEILEEKIREGSEFKVFKVKLNGENDKQIIEAIRSFTDKPIAVDVNQGWKDKEKALDMIHWLKEQQVLFVEQPLQKEKWEDAAWLYERSPLPLFADESIQRFAELDKMKDCFHGINIKLMKCTGLHEAHRMIRKSKQLQLKILIGCMSETSCAISAAAQLSPLCDHADLDGNLLIRNDLFSGVTVAGGKLMLNDKPGIGAKPLSL
jgi:L-alanine-DL-glutamate epimerase-like enolase superfamily enzyme